MVPLFINILFLVWYLDLFRIWWASCSSMKLLCNVVFRNSSQVCSGSLHLCHFLWLCVLSSMLLEKCCCICRFWFWYVLLTLIFWGFACRVALFALYRHSLVCLSSILWNCLEYLGLFAWWVVFSCFGCFFSGPYCWEKFRITCAF